MKRMGLLVLSCIVLLAPGGYAAAQVAGSTTLGVTVEELRAVAIGWSARSTAPVLARNVRRSITG